MDLQEHEHRIKALEAARKELEDSFLVMTHLETRQSSVIKALAQQSEQFATQMEAQRKLNAETDKRISDLVSAIGALIDRSPKWAN